MAALLPLLACPPPLQVGCTAAFSVPGDFTLLLLDNMLRNRELQARAGCAAALAACACLCTWRG
jgi:TPP-dependent 2-oxoacid decarboxylase